MKSDSYLYNSLIFLNLKLLLKGCENVWTLFFLARVKAITSQGNKARMQVFKLLHNLGFCIQYLLSLPCFKSTKVSEIMQKLGYLKYTARFLKLTTRSHIMHHPWVTAGLSWCDGILQLLRNATAMEVEYTRCTCSLKAPQNQHLPQGKKDTKWRNDFVWQF